MYKVWYERNLGPELMEAPEDYTWNHQPSFTIVRNPLHRLVSAWREKLGPMTEGDLLADKANFFVINFSFYLFFLNIHLLNLIERCCHSNY